MTLRRYLRPAAGPAPGAPAPADTERCELCGAPLPERHDHLVDRHSRALPCACRPCWLLFPAPSATGGAARYAAIPDAVTALPGFPLTEREWAALDLPVRLAFVYRDSALHHPVALYPSPAGAAESPLAADTWAELLARHPATAALPEDVAALLMHRGDQGPECFVVPIDACYRLVGLVRTHWRGFDGGEQARAAVAGFLDEVRAGARTEAAVA
ncbi:hypothetical protein Cs7R123_18350 [Catellatospora sp. TT07R-123]|uniref:DUF5947 family protein n=1 Tax=Catellatospora sp. TT07R-123 TaxID=2733863 RepID=UPI001B2160BD|nr:DUF5947 family protein [Catellatospora sp. TT07R-123]GHJ44493.1 hypothetical protein Cs7R123_18350 [Catellatospora sp. TT07R-123]